ncbi:MAG: hypothetical protein KBI01_09605 [Oscillospiraceae bacterium]|nr:hypothetical protein [Oscillospiraceae bacterium]
MKRATKFPLILLAVLIFAGGLIVIYQWDNIKAIYVAKTHTSEEIEAMIDKNNELSKEAVSDLDVRELTDQEREALENGELDSDEALNRILETEKNTSFEEADDTSTESKPERDYKAELSSLIGQVYILEATFSGALDNLVSSAVAEYKALPAEQHTDAKKWEIGMKYLGTAASMEANCDQQMEAILSQIKSVLTASGDDLELLDQIKSAYRNEKILKKDYYLSLYS